MWLKSYALGQRGCTNEMKCQWNVPGMKVFIPIRYPINGEFFGITDYLCCCECPTVNCTENLISQLVSLVRSVVWCIVLKKAFVGLWDALGCVLLACEGRRGSERSLSLSALAQRSLLAFWLSASVGPRVFQKRALATGRQVSQPARQAASRIVCSLGLGLVPGLGQLKLPRQIC